MPPYTTGIAPYTRNSDYGKRKLVKNNKLSLHSYDLIEAKTPYSSILAQRFALFSKSCTLCAKLSLGIS